MSNVQTDDFFKSLGINDADLSFEEKKVIAMGFLQHFMICVLDEYPEIANRIPEYMKEYKQILKR